MASDLKQKKITKNKNKNFNLREKLPVSQKLRITSEGEVSFNVLYYEQLSIAHNQSFYAKHYFE